MTMVENISFRDEIMWPNASAFMFFVLFSYEKIVFGYQRKVRLHRKSKGYCNGLRKPDEIHYWRYELKYIYFNKIPDRFGPISRCRDSYNVCMVANTTAKFTTLCLYTLWVQVSLTNSCYCLTMISNAAGHLVQLCVIFRRFHIRA